MKLSTLKPAWRQFQLLNSMQPVEKEEILLLLERAEVRAFSTTHRMLTNATVFMILAGFCQGG